MAMTHNQRVAQFFRYCQRYDPQKYKEVCEKYPILSKSQWETVGTREVNVGLIGLGPTHIPPHIAAEHGIESPVRDGDA